MRSQDFYHKYYSSGPLRSGTSFWIKYTLTLDSHQAEKHMHTWPIVLTANCLAPFGELDGVRNVQWCGVGGAEGTASILNGEQKKKKTTWTHQTGPFLFDHCQVTKKKRAFMLGQSAEWRLQRRRHGFIWKTSWVGRLLLSPIEHTAEHLANFPSSSPRGFIVNPAHAILKPHAGMGAGGAQDNTGVKRHWMEYD